MEIEQETDLAPLLDVRSKGMRFTRESKGQVRASGYLIGMPLFYGYFSNLSE